MRKYRGGDIALGDGRPRGLPFLRPLYGLPPYQYTNETVLMVLYEAKEAAIREVLPSELEPLPGNVVAMCFFVCPEVTSVGPHNFSMPCIHVRHGDYVGQFVPYVYTNTIPSLAAYREGQGWPAVFGETEITEKDGIVNARVVSDGHEIIRASAAVSRSHPIAAVKLLKRTTIGSWEKMLLTLLSGGAASSLEVLPIILYKEIPSMDGTKCDAAYFLTSTSRLTNVEFKAGSKAEVSFPDPAGDPIARLEPLTVTGALYGTMDDFYPETMRVLPNLKT